MLECIYFFVIGAFAGWLMECSFKYYSKNFSNTPGILNTPFCILYGVGNVFLSMVISRWTNNVFLLFFFSMVILTALEYITYVLLDKIYGVRLWNYTDMKFNIGAKVCLEFAIAWGVIGVAYIKFLLPIFMSVLNTVNPLVLSQGMSIIMYIIVMDFIYSSVSLIVKKQLLNEENDV